MAGRICSRVFLAVLALLLPVPQLCALVPWLPFGPDGGDARRIASDPSDPGHLYLGTANGWLYQSHNAGASWVRLACISKRDDFAIDSIIIDPTDPRHIVIGAWAIDHSDGGIFTSLDGGNTWTNQAEMRGQSVLALAASKLNPKILVAGTLRGVYRSIDGGLRWTRISPPDSVEIHNIQSVAISPRDPNTIYVGTWHLPWRTTDGGDHWENMKDGIIDDSDVFSIIIDPKRPKIVYASACSGIYKSEDAGQLFHKIEGIPSTARRTRRLLQDPNNLDIVFAGTTEGLYRSVDAGKTWARTTGPEVIINDVEIDPRNSSHVLLATDRGGVLSSDDGGDTFHGSNGGFSARQITSVQLDRLHPAVLYIGVVNDKNWGGVFESDNGGIQWMQRSSGLEGRDVFALGQAPDGTIIAGTSHGLFRLENDAKDWVRIENAPSGIETEPLGVTKAKPHPTHLSPGSPRAKPVIKAAAHHTTARHSSRSAAKTRVTSTRLANKSNHATPLKRAAAPRHTSSKTLQTAQNVQPPAILPTPADSSSLTAMQTTSPANTAPAVLPTAVAVQAKLPVHTFDGSVYSVATSDQTLLAATSIGLLSSVDNGQSWQVAGPKPSTGWRLLATAQRLVVSASFHAVQLSADSGTTWSDLPLPEKFTRVTALAVDPSGAVWIGGQEGLFVSSDHGATWATPKNLFLTSVSSLFFDAPSDRMVVTTAGASSYVFTVQLADHKVTFAESGWSLRLTRPVGDYLVAATLFDGIVVQPRMVDSPIAAPTPAKAAITANPAPNRQ